MTRTKRETKILSVRLESSLAERLRKATAKNTWPPPPSITQIVSRGIELVLRELEKQK